MLLKLPASAWPRRAHSLPFSSQAENKDLCIFVEIRFFFCFVFPAKKNKNNYLYFPTFYVEARTHTAPNGEYTGLKEKKPNRQTAT